MIHIICVHISENNMSDTLVLCSYCPLLESTKGTDVYVIYDGPFFVVFHAPFHTSHNNDRNTPFKHNGVYHLFLQQNCDIGWGHLVSHDLAMCWEVGKHTRLLWCRRTYMLEHLLDRRPNMQPFVVWRWVPNFCGEASSDSHRWLLFVVRCENT